MPFDPTQPFTRAQGDTAGLTWRQLSGPRFQRLFHGIYIAASVVATPEIRARAALLAVGGDAVICDVSAAQLRQLPTPPCEDVHVLVPPGAPRVQRAGIVVHRGTRRLSVHRGVPLTTMQDTFVDVAARYPLVDAVVLGDAMAREGYATPRQLVTAAAAVGGPDGRRIRRASALVRSRARYPQETRLRLLMVLSGLPEPVTGFPVVAAGRKRELDTAYEQWKVAVEYDGRHHVERDLQWSEDIERHEDLDGEQWKVVIVTGMQMLDPDRVLTRIRTALTNAGASLPPSSQEWRRYFPTRRRPKRD